MVRHSTLTFVPFSATRPPRIVVWSGPWPTIDRLQRMLSICWHVVPPGDVQLRSIRAHPRPIPRPVSFLERILALCRQELTHFRCSVESASIMRHVYCWFGKKCLHVLVTGNAKKNERHDARSRQYRGPSKMTEFSSTSVMEVRSEIDESSQHRPWSTTRFQWSVQGRKEVPSTDLH